MAGKETAGAQDGRLLRSPVAADRKFSCCSSFWRWGSRVFDLKGKGRKERVLGKDLRFVSVRDSSFCCSSFSNSAFAVYHRSSVSQLWPALLHL